MLKEVINMFVKGTKKEIEWLYAALANGCTECPYEKECSECAQQDVLTNGNGGVRLSCKDYLQRRIQCEITEE